MAKGKIEQQTPTFFWVLLLHPTSSLVLYSSTASTSPYQPCSLVLAFAYTQEIRSNVVFSQAKWKVLKQGQGHQLFLCLCSCGSILCVRLNTAQIWPSWSHHMAISHEPVCWKRVGKGMWGCEDYQPSSACAQGSCKCKQQNLGEQEGFLPSVFQA